MYKIDELMNMLDCNNSIEIQEKGIELAKNVKNIKVFVLPQNESYNKNVWENCAKILEDRTDDELTICLSELMAWIKDWENPGALTIIKRLRGFSETRGLSAEINNCAKVARATNNQKWLISLAQFIDVEKIRKNFSAETWELLEPYYNNSALRKALRGIDIYDIDEIITMLDWNNSEEIQQRGIELAQDIKCINAFILPSR